MKYEDFLARVAQKAGLDRGQAAAATQSVLSVLGESLSEKKAQDLASQLPRELKIVLENAPGHGRPRLASEFVQLVGERESIPESQARLHTQAVLSTLREAVDRGEMRDVISELWRDPEYAELWAPPLVAAPPPPAEEPEAAEVRLTYEE
jgi:uncharacterized protein (DUF2267 family)